MPVLSIPDMARTHGVVNALGFTLCGLAGHRLAAPLPTDEGPADKGPVDGRPLTRRSLGRRSVVPS